MTSYGWHFLPFEDPTHGNNSSEWNFTPLLPYASLRSPPHPQQSLAKPNQRTWGQSFLSVLLWFGRRLSNMFHWRTTQDLNLQWLGFTRKGIYVYVSGFVFKESDTYSFRYWQQQHLAFVPWAAGGRSARINNNLHLLWKTFTRNAHLWLFRLRRLTYALLIKTISTLNISHTANCIS